MPVGFFSVAGKEIRPARAHVADHMFHDERDGVHLRIKNGDELLICYLLHGAFRQFLVITKDGEGVLNVIGGELDCHALNTIPKARWVARLSTASARYILASKASGLPA